MIAAGLLLLTTVDPSPPPAEIKGADLALVQSVRAIAERAARTVGASSPPPVLALRASEEVRVSEARRRAEQDLAPARAAARGRAWADVGFGAEGDPAALALALALDLPGIGLDADRSRLLVDPGRLVEDDGVADPSFDQAASLLLATGVAPDEPVVAHYTAHRMSDPPLALETPTTDRLLARHAFAEGAANLAALLFLFEGVGLEAEVIEGRVRPEDVLGGRLVPEAMRSDRATVARLVEFVYLDGFAAVAALTRQAGMRRLPSERGMRGTTRDLLHLDRPPAVPHEFSPPAALEQAGLVLADRDALGEQGIVTWVSLLSGKDNLGMIAGDGWAGDALWRFETAEPGASPAGVTLWESQWLTEDDAKDFAYAVERCFAGRFPADAIVDAGEGVRVLTRPDRVFRLERRGRGVTLRVATPEWEARLAPKPKKKGASPRPS